MPRSRTKAKDIKTKQKHARAVELRLAGATLQQIADQLKYKTREGARQAVLAAIKLMVREPAEEMIEIESFRLDKLQVNLWANALSGDSDGFRLVAVNRCQLHRTLWSFAPEASQWPLRTLPPETFLECKPPGFQPDHLPP